MSVRKIAMPTRFFVAVLSVTALAAGLTTSARQAPQAAQAPPAQPLAPLVLPTGFQASVFAENVENARSMVLAPQGTVFVGFPFCHQGDVQDPQFGAERACSTTEPPAQTMGAHVAAIGFAFYTGNMFPASYLNAAIIAQHGSWNRNAAPGGYRVMVARSDGRRVTANAGRLDPDQ